MIPMVITFAIVEKIPKILCSKIIPLWCQIHGYYNKIKQEKERFSENASFAF